MKKIICAGIALLLAAVTVVSVTAFAYSDGLDVAENTAMKIVVIKSPKF